MTNKFALTLGAALLLTGQAMAATPVPVLRGLAKQVARTYCGAEMQAQLVGETAFARGQVAGFVREELTKGYELTAAEKGFIGGYVRELTLGGYCEPGSI